MFIYTSHKFILILVPECTNKIPSNEPKANSACKLSDITACGANQACQQTDPKSPWGTCTCLSGYSLQADNVSKIIYSYIYCRSSKGNYI